MKLKKKHSHLGIIIPILVIFFNLLLILNPKEMVAASKNGLMIWFNNALPSLLPFIITTNLLTSLKVINLFGVIFAPIMKPLFGVSGKGSFPFVVGITSGYPIGAKVVSELRQNNEISQIEGQRLLSFVNNSGPLFILGAIGVGVFASEKIGFFLFLINFLSAVLNGILFRNYKKNDDIKGYKEKISLKSAIRDISLSMEEKPLTSMLSESIINAFQTIIAIGGFIIFFSVIVKALEIVNIIGVFENFLCPVLTLLNISPAVFKGMFYGAFEVTGGISCFTGIPFSKIVILITCFLIAFAGFSIHAQSASFIAKTDLKISVYVFSKFIQGILAVIIGYILFPFYNFNEAVHTFSNTYFSPVDELKGSIALSLLMIAAFILTYLILTILTVISHKYSAEKK